MINPTETVRLFESQPEQKFDPGEVIFNNGDQGKIMYGVIEGTVEMLLDGKVIETIEKGNVFGQGALVHTDHIRTSTAIAKTQCQLACLDQEHFLFAVQQTPMFAIEIMRSYSDRYRRLKKLIQYLGNI
ncbi:MAG TPA: cyclic nucleotide-binding protein [Cyanothece sp. UBA12306]|nr:cyclic nucleotide-binding protein [Cyanothece sp. UBA12306]